MVTKGGGRMGARGRVGSVDQLSLWRVVKNTGWLDSFWMFFPACNWPMEFKVGTWYGWSMRILCIVCVDSTMLWYIDTILCWLVFNCTNSPQDGFALYLMFKLRFISPYKSLSGTKTGWNVERQERNATTIWVIVFSAVPDRLLPYILSIMGAGDRWRKPSRYQKLLINTFICSHDENHTTQYLSAYNPCPVMLISTLSTLLWFIYYTWLPPVAECTFT
jgi:hypothetical protein